MQRTRPRTLNHSLQDLDVLMHNSKLHVRSCAGSFFVSTVHYIVLYSYTTYVIITHQRTSTFFIYSTISILYSLVFFTTDHFILFVHSSRMFYYFVCSHAHVVGSWLLLLDAGRLPVCLLACCQWGYRVIPSYLKCAQLWATVFIIMCMESAVAPTSACWQLMLGRSPWSAPPSQILHVFHVIQTLFAFTGIFTACYQLKLSLVSTILQPLTT